MINVDCILPHILLHVGLASPVIIPSIQDNNMLIKKL
jgi:hypothetical protein